MSREDDEEIDLTGDDDELSDDELEQLRDGAMAQNTPFETQSPKTALTILDHIEQILDAAKDAQNEEDFQKKAKQHISAVSRKLKITQVQAVIFAHMVGKANDNCIYPSELQESLHCTTIQLIRYLNDLDELENKKLIAKGRNKSKKSYQVPELVIDALRHNRAIKVQGKKNLTIYRFFDELESILQKILDEEVSLEEYVEELKLLIGYNMHLTICKAFMSYRLSNDALALLSLFCEFLVNNNDEDIDLDDIARLFHERSKYHRIRQGLVSGNYSLAKKGLIENTASDRFARREEFMLTDRARSELLSELDINLNNAKMKKGLILSNEIPAKTLYYNAKEEKQIAELRGLLQPDNFKSIQKRLKQKGMCNGFACLFYGPPGTGKTETVNQIARLTGRDVLLVDIAETKSCWFGESEKRIKKVFDQYRTYVKVNSVAPILLFNEADAVIGKRKDVNSGNVAQTENTIQNIILQEMETLNGIMIATTNLTKNLDPAFERRFLYKVAFTAPTLEARTAIWKSHIPELCDADAQALAQRFDFSGGQIENIARKRTIDSIIHANKINLETLTEYCRDEKLDKSRELTIGFKSVH
ncbi:ATP-binding protein [Breznakiellaceae bacterium SP9]